MPKESDNKDRPVRLATCPAQDEMTPMESSGHSMKYR